ncbi:AraC family transcriptional regulator [Umezawaea sp. Da 62-37]|uniref:AraC family transcriptional regulator n=1 Tax=Umezawaea sp. Da 62-37 TaxID=3075927 RepID=UPI0028F6C879|nr:AraC family transcriptional regulator [Umezawaea sp. Da 62-37]WNV83344.1 AraC family transcriptional regulator [Umezawaea sp. Da 62-37]
MELSSDHDDSVRQFRRNAQGVLVVDYVRAAGLPSVTVVHWVGDRHRHPLTLDTHAHDFLVLFYVQHGDASMRVDGRDWPLTTGDAFVVAPGTVITPERARVDEGAESWAVFFPADAIDPAAAASLVSWRTHPLLSPFIGNHRGGGQRLHVPPDERAKWLGHLADLDGELRGRRDGYADAARAHLTLLLVHLGRLHVDLPGDAAVEPLLAAVFEVVENRYHEPISLRDVAEAVGLTTGHLTTVIGKRTGRTVQQWITERRMREARRLLADTDLTIAETAQRVGYRDTGYFIRRFRTAHRVTPTAWREAGR